MTVEYKLSPEQVKVVSGISRRVKIKNLPKTAFNLVKARVINDLLWESRIISEEAKSSADKAAVLVTNSRQDAMVLRKLDEGSIAKSFENWEGLRSVRIPWVSNLSVEEVLQLRERAADALPKFRDKMNKELYSISTSVDDPDKLSLQVAKRLREEANELDAELKAAAKKTGHAYHVGMGVTGISCIIYGVGTNDPTAINAGATLTAALGAMYPSSKQSHAEHEHLKTKPAYVLLSAREIIRRRKR